MRTFAALAFVGTFAVICGLAAGGRPVFASPIEVSQVQADNQEKLEGILSACERSYRIPGLDPIRHKVELARSRTGGIPEEVSPPNAYPTAAERQAILLWATLRDACTSKVTAFLRTAPLPVGANRETVEWGNSFLLRGMAATGELISGLSQGRLTYAVYALTRAELVKEVDTERSRWHQAMLTSPANPRPREAEQADNRFTTFLADLSAALSKQSAQSAAVESSPRPTSERLYEAPLNLTYPKGPDRPEDVAVIIGNGDYTRLGHDIPDVRPAHADAASIRLYVTQALGIRDKNIITLKDATAAQMTAVFGSDKNPRGQLFDWVKPGLSRVFVYYAGHGAPGVDGGGPYLVPADAEASRIGLSAYPLPLLYDNLSKLPAERVTVVLEACFSGQSQAGTLVSRASPILISSKTIKPPASLTVIAAAAGDQIASWEQDGSHGLFTEYFLKGMAGEASKPPYGKGDGNVTLDQLGRYLKETLSYWARRYYGRDQSAQITQGEEK
ncbi:MAG: caspase family protein [Alphaproteobacteria bacterium]|nr:caspase family protein [Alphaproteobacteria bacterium]